MTYDVAKALQDRDQLWESAPKMVEVGVVSGIINSTTIKVNCSGKDESVNLIIGLSPIFGETVLLLRNANRKAWAIARLPAIPFPTGIPQGLPSAEPTGTNYFQAEVAASWSSGQWRTEWTGMVQDLAKSASWFYGSTPQDMLAGYTITGAKIKLKRLTGGSGKPQPVHLFLHSSQFQDEFSDVTRSGLPTDIMLSVNQDTWATIPAAWGQSIVDNGGGISMVGAPYVVVEGINSPDSGSLQLDWSR